MSIETTITVPKHDWWVTAGMLTAAASAAVASFTGLRGGEKLNEALFSAAEERIPTDHPRIWATKAAAPLMDLDAAVDHLIEAASLNRSDLVRHQLAALLPGFTKVPAPSTATMVAPYPDGF